MAPALFYRHYDVRVMGILKRDVIQGSEVNIFEMYISYVEKIFTEADAEMRSF